MYGQRQGGGFRIPPTFLIAVVMAGFALCKYYGSSSHNEITGETQHISISPQQEIAMGLQSAPQMAQEFGGRRRTEVRHHPERIDRRAGHAVHRGRLYP